MDSRTDSRDADALSAGASSDPLDMVDDIYGDAEYVIAGRPVAGPPPLGPINSPHRQYPGPRWLRMYEAGARPYSISDMIHLFGITAAEMGLITRRSERTVRRWIAGQNPPMGRARYRIELLQAIAYALEWAVGPDDMALWIRSPNEHLAGRVPLEYLMQDRLVELHSLLRTGHESHRHPYFRKRAVPPEPSAAARNRGKTVSDEGRMR
jgi:hypothetical protein